MTTQLFRFNVVGALGLLVQLSVLLGLRWCDVPVAVATLIAVETAVMHNFVWHERWTWPGMKGGTRAQRLARFHLTNGLVSLAGNVLLTAMFASAGLPVVLANVAAVAMCVALNFASAHLWVFCAKTWPTFHGHLH